MARQLTPLNTADKAGFNRFYAGPLGSDLLHKRQCVKAFYDFADQGGAVGTINLHDEDGNDVVLPLGAIITQVWTDEVTNVTTSASGTLSLGAATTVDLLAATAAATFAGVQAGIPTGTAANMIKLAAAATLTGSIATGALTAGKIAVYVEFVYIP